MDAVGLSFEFAKSDASGGYVRGWASVISVAGRRVEDYHGDVIEIETLRKAAHEFITNQRVAKAMHGGTPVGEVVESIIIDDEIAKALGIADERRGWFIGMRVHDEGIRKRVRSGELRAFSIGGRGAKRKVA